MSKTPRRSNYDRKLARSIQLGDGTRLITLRDAADLLQRQFATVTKWGALEHCIELLIAAAESGSAPTSSPRLIRSSACSQRAG